MWLRLSLLIWKGILIKRTKPRVELGGAVVLNLFGSTDPKYFEEPLNRYKLIPRHSYKANLHIVVTVERITLNYFLIQAVIFILAASLQIQGFPHHPG